MERALPGLHDLGIRLVEIPLLRPNELDASAARTLAERNKMELVCSLGLPGRLRIVEQADEVVAFLRNALEVTARTGAPSLSGVLYGTLGYTSGKPRTELEMDAVCRVLEQAARIAWEHRLSIGIEPCNRYETHLLNRARDAYEVVERIGAENLFIHLDTYHMNIEEESFAAGFSDARKYLGYVHLSESHRGVPGRGMINWPSVMMSLAKLGYNGPLVLESFNFLHPDIASGLAVWHPVADDPDSVLSVGVPFLAKGARDAGMILEPQNAGVLGMGKSGPIIPIAPL
jgi:D-psicose/D-tagatose/L-ribulose 3-epimerase